MLSPSPSDLVWVIGFTPQGHWIAPVVRAAVRAEWPEAQQIASAQKDAAVGIVDFNGLPAGIADDLREGGPSLVLSEAGPLFAALRTKADPAEIALAGKAAAIAHHALEQARGGSLNAMIAAAEQQAQKNGTPLSPNGMQRAPPLAP